MAKVNLTDFFLKANNIFSKLKIVNSNLLKEDTSSSKSTIDALSHLQALKDLIENKMNELKKNI